jgi:hypothetical protein
MLAIGLGKLEGAKSAHAHARRIGMEAVIRSVYGKLLDSGRILGGLAILEDAWHHTAQVAAVRSADLIGREEELLRVVTSWRGSIPVAALDVLILDEIGKNVSGTGMDTKVVNRSVHGHYNPWPELAKIERIFVRDLSDLSYGSGVGMGLADIMHDRVLEKLDVRAGRVNATTAGSLAAVRTPLHFPSDLECLDLAASTVGKFDHEDVTIAWIRNTMELQTLWVSESLADEIGKHAVAEVSGDPFPIRFDEAGNLRQPTVMR